MDTVQRLRDQEESLLKASGLSPDVYQLHYAGQTALQLDVREMNQRDTILLFSRVTVLLTLMLGIQTRSVLMPVLMMGTILLSYFATLGFSWFIFKYLMGYEAINYRLPVYTFAASLERSRWRRDLLNGRRHSSAGVDSSRYLLCPNNPATSRAVSLLLYNGCRDLTGHLLNPAALIIRLEVLKDVSPPLSIFPLSLYRFRIQVINSSSSVPSQVRRVFCNM